MASAYTTDIQKLYVAYFNRPADVAGLAYWDSVLASGAGTLGGIGAAFAASAEYKAAFDQMNSAAIVAQVYQNLFGRPAEAAGVGYWADLLDAGLLSIDTIVKNIADGALGSDKTIFANKVAAAGAFTGAMDTPAEIAAYKTAPAALAAKNFISGIRTDANLAFAVQNMAATLQQFSQAGKQLTLTASTDKLFGASNNDLFTGAAGTLQTADTFDGGAGIADRLKADIGTSGYNLVRPTGQLVEQVELRAVAEGAGGRVVVFDGANVTGVNHWESNASSADLIVDGARVDGERVTRDVTVVMRDSAPGDVDFAVYFNSFTSLRHVPLSQNELRVQLAINRDSGSVEPLSNSPYTGFAVVFNGVLTKISSTAIDAARTYDALYLAIKDAVAAIPAMRDVVVAKGVEFTVADGTGKSFTGTEILLSSQAGDVFVVNAAEVGFLLPAGLNVPHPSTVTNVLSTDNPKAFAHASSTIVLDGVGTGALGGDLVVGANSSADFFGVERFDIEVQDNSQLQTLGSTNNALREVYLRNGSTSTHFAADPNRPQDKGSLAVLGPVAPVVSGSKNDVLAYTIEQKLGVGLLDVRVIDASAMVGKLAFTAELSVASLSKYFPARASGNAPADTVRFAYSGGAADDSMTVSVERAVLASHAAFGPARSDAALALNGGAGNDTITVTLSGSAPISDNNLSVTGGLGDDRIVLDASAGPASHDTLIYAGAFGNDVVVNFGAAADLLDFSALGGRGHAFAGAAVAAADLSITVQAASAANDSAAKIAALYTDGSVAATHVFVAVSAGNVGSVYAVVDGASSGVSATLVGTIDLGQAGWSNLSAANFA